MGVEQEVDQLYPFDEALEGREHELFGLEKLRSYRDRELAARLLVLWRQSRPDPKRTPPAQTTLPLGGGKETT